MCKIFTALELHNKSRNELSALFRTVTQELNETNPDTAKRRNRLASLENISRAMLKPSQP
ncbi:MAG: hypothetical protein KAJ40_04710 [Alphaproteobacteria bacterium]|nr:hypothetical protein [Alphaproteobacteria bacterium]